MGHPVQCKAKADSLLKKRGSPSGVMRSVDPGSLFTRQSCILSVVSKAVHTAEAEK